MSIETRQKIERRHIALSRPIRVPRCPSLDHGNNDGGDPPINLNRYTRDRDEDGSTLFWKTVGAVAFVGASSAMTFGMWKAIDLMGSVLPEDDYYRTLVLPTFKWVGAATLTGRTIRGLIGK